jgi:hypothetical protein
MKYTIYVTRVSTYEVEAKTSEDPFDVFMDQDPAPIDEETTDMRSEPDAPEPDV